MTFDWPPENNRDMKLSYEFKVNWEEISAYDKDARTRPEFWNEMNRYCKDTLSDNVYIHFKNGDWIFYIRYIEDWVQFKLRWC